MLNIYCNTKFKRPLKASDKLSRYLRSNRFKDSVRKSWLALVLCFLFVFSASGVAAPQAVHADSKDYLLDKVITWGDGSTEHVQIGDDGFFRLNGIKSKLVGMFLSVHHMPYGETGEFWLPENLTIYDKELAYLESVGIRLIHTPLHYALWWRSPLTEEERYSAFLDLLYKRKMLVVAQIEAKGMPNFGSLDNPDFSFTNTYGESDTLGAFAIRWADVVGRYPNVVVVVAENELDGPFEGQDYTSGEVADYMDFLTGILRSRINAPIVHKLIADSTNMSEYRESIHRVCLSMTDNPTYDCHLPSVGQLDSVLAYQTSWLNQEGYPTTGWWVLEMNKACPPYTAGFGVDFIDTVFKHGATVATLFVSNWSTQPDWQFFANNGAPKPALVAIASEIDRLQAPIDTMLAQR